MDRLRKVHLCRVYIVVAILCNVIPMLLYGNAYSKLDALGIICTFELFIFVYINAQLHGTMMNYGTMFTAILFVFHFGQLVLYSFFRPLYSHIRILLLINVNDVLYGFNCMHASFSAICVGMSISTIDRKNDVAYIKAEIEAMRGDTKRIVLLIAKFVPNRYVELVQRWYGKLLMRIECANRLIRTTQLHKRVIRTTTKVLENGKKTLSICIHRFLTSKWYTTHLLQIEDQKKNFGVVAKCIIICTFPFKLVIDVLCLYVFFTQGGVEAREWVNNFPNVFLFIGKVSLVGFAIMLLIYKEQVRKQTILFISIVMYIILMMISGIRSENVGYLCVFFLLYFASTKVKIRFRHVLLIGVAGICALAFIVTVGQLREVEDKTWVTYMGVFVNYLTRQNVVFYLLDTCGDTGYTAQCVINKWLPEYGPTFGDSYILGSAAIIPNIPGVITWPGRLTEASCFPMRLQAAGTLSKRYLNIGGSLLGEMFFNFGILGGILFAFLFGTWMGSVSQKCTKYIKTNNYFGMIWVVPVMFAVTYWTRHYFGGQIREMVWGPIVCLMVMKLLHQIQHSKKRNVQS